MTAARFTIETPPQTTDTAIVEDPVYVASDDVFGCTNWTNNVSTESTLERWQ